MAGKGTVTEHKMFAKGDPGSGWGTNEGRIGAFPMTYTNCKTEDGKLTVYVSEGEFTAICAFGGGVCCFKEGLLHKILGTTPGSYYVSDYTLPGVKQGCERSVQTISDTLCYRGVHGVYAYSGAAPKLISRELGDNLPDCAVSGTDGRMYYLSGLVGGNPVRYAYDTFGKVWIKEADEQAAAIACVGGTTYMLTDGSLYKIGMLDKSQSRFMAEFVPFCEDTFRKKCYTRLVFGITMAPDSTLRVYTRCDGGEYRLTYTHTPDSRCSLSIPIRVQRCSRFGVRLEGRGEVAITGLAREFALLSEVCDVFYIGGTKVGYGSCDRQNAARTDGHQRQRRGQYPRLSRLPARADQFCTAEPPGSYLRPINSNQMGIAAYRGNAHNTYSTLKEREQL